MNKKFTFTAVALSCALLLTGGCKKEELEVYQLQQACSPTAKTVRTITNAAGIVSFDQALQQYRVSVHQPGTIDVVAIGVVCGTLPAALQADGTRVTVTGTLKEYAPAPAVALPAGYTYYYLEIANIQ